MTSQATDAEILRQLAEMQRSLGETSATIEAIREDVATNTHETKTHRDAIVGNINNALHRISQLETNVQILMQTMEKTVNPLINGYRDSRQRIIGFLAAWGLVASGIGLLFWLVTGGFSVIASIVSRAVQAP